MQKCPKMTIFNRFRPFSGTLKLFGEILKNLQIFSKCSPCMFSSEKNFISCYFIFSPKDLLANAKLSSGATVRPGKTGFFPSI